MDLSYCSDVSIFDFEQVIPLIEVSFYQSSLFQESRERNL